MPLEQVMNWLQGYQARNSAGCDKAKKPQLSAIAKQA
jgi:hypothetical protein